MKASTIFKDFFRKEGSIYLLGLLVLAIIDIGFLFLPELVGNAIDTLQYNKEGLSTYIYYIIALGSLITVLKIISRRTLLGSIRRMEYLFRQRICTQALQIPATYYELHGPGKVMALMTNDVTSLRVALGLGVMIIVDIILYSILGSIILIEKIDFLLAAQIMTPIFFILLAIFVLGRILRKKQRQAQNTYSDMTEFGQELFQGMDVIRAFNKERIIGNLFNSINRKNYNHNMEVALYDSLLTPLTMVAPFICVAISIYICGTLAVKGAMSVGEFVTINSFIMLIVGPLIGFGSLVAIMQKGLASLDRIVEFMDIPVEDVSIGENQLPLGPIDIRYLNFTYEGSKSPTLKQVNLTIEPNQFIGIVGKPGSGKTTLFKLLLGLESAPPKSVYINNQDIRNISLGTLRNSISYVPTQSYLLGTSISDNISFGYENSNHISVQEAAEMATLYRDLGDALDNPLSTLQEEGRDLSGGQKQRINMARGFYKNAPYLILDDCFSALDAITVNTIVKTLQSVQNKTIICSSQRLEVIENADQIIVFDDGMIAEVGTHQKLLQKEGIYYNLYSAQNRRGQR
ncbi:ABC transporter ATP-binding protein [Veillonella agrestimuris]|uniref:ABC transporter ATP-binding protein n=1 Tax=Veillonella agrestimuris TaxID=2941340 RepID=UPI00203A7696|nr:ABC transporter ATP-binding protein [Veillonella agrestimuris]